MRRRQPLPLGDGPEQDAAKMMGMPLAEFRKKLPRLLSRAFPPADPDTGKFDLDAINEWRRQRFPNVFPVVTNSPTRSLATALQGRDADEEIERGLAMNG